MVAQSAGGAKSSEFNSTVARAYLRVNSRASSDDVSLVGVGEGNSRTSSEAVSLVVVGEGVMFRDVGS